jgi:membrane protein YqaA with SNARE-associated domain
MTRTAYHVGHNYGYWALLLSWLPIIGDPLTLVAGMVKLNFFYFLVIAATLRVARYIVVLYFT